jgi:hypothetical protein
MLLDNFFIFVMLLVPVCWVKKMLHDPTGDVPEV